MDHVPIGVYISVIFGLFISLMLIIVYLRYHKFTSRDYVLFYRAGNLLHSGYGGAYFVLPLLDELVVIDTADHRVEFTINQQIVFKPKFKSVEYDGKIDYVVINGFVLYQVDDPLTFYSNAGRMYEDRRKGDITPELFEFTSFSLRDIIEGALRKFILSADIDDLYNDRFLLERHIDEIIRPHVERLGLKIVDIEISRFSFS